MKTPKEKAEELVKKFTAHAHGEDGEQNWINATLCALIAVEAMIEETNHYQDLVSVWQDNDGKQTVIQRLKYWQEVKNELQKM